MTKYELVLVVSAKLEDDERAAVRVALCRLLYPVELAKGSAEKYTELNHNR